MAPFKEKTARIRELNDAFRKTFTGGKLLMTASVAELPDMVKAAALQTLASFDASAFDKCNDPYGEHDFIAFDLCGRTFFFKIDYFDIKLEYASEDPSDPKKTTRVGTLMLSRDY